MRRIAWLGAFGSFVALMVAAGCGSSAHDSNFGTGDDASTADSSGGDDAGGNDDAISFGDSSKEGGNCDTHCSSDLHSVVDCNNKVVMTCPPDKGCAAGGCVAPCDSAKANKSTFGCDYFSVDPDI